MEVAKYTVLYLLQSKEKLLKWAFSDYILLTTYNLQTKINVLFFTTVELLNRERLLSR